MKDFLKLEEHFKNHPKRYIHTLGVLEEAKYLNKLFNLNLPEYDLEMACLLHDYAKIYSFEDSIKLLSKYESNLVIEYLKDYPTVIHSILGAHLIKEKFDVSDDVFDAVYYHTTGKKNMSTLSKVVYVSDCIEKNRNFPNVEFYRDVVHKNLDLGVYEISKGTIELLKRENKSIEVNTFETYDYYKELVNEI
jgi:predicted HD superfamily hydrolase involved in NAD metabolism